MTLPLEGKNVVLGVTGGIAAYKSCEVTSRLRKEGAKVFVIMTKNACEFVRPLTFETLSGNPVVDDTFARPNTWEVEHVALAKKADLFVIAPATANILAKLVHGIADDMLSTTVLATSAPILVAPAMNTGMWNNPATQENVQKLLSRGVSFIGPEGGYLACGDTGKGRMSEPESIVAAILSMLQTARDMEGLKVLVTAGPTRENLDPVRYLTNRSSGKMGYALAQEALSRGAEVTLVSGPVSLLPVCGAQMVYVNSTEDLCEKMLALCPEQDIIVQAAAPADYTPVQVSAQKIKKQKGEELTLTLRETPDVAARVGENKKPGQTLIGFAAETENLAQNAVQKLKRKNLDMIVGNDVTKPGVGFDVDTNQVTLFTREGAQALEMMSKRQAAGVILSQALALRK